MSRRCIICWLRGHTGSDLITVCPNCSAPPLASAHTRSDALQDDKSLVRSITSTLSPRYQKAEPAMIYMAYKQLIHKAVRSFKQPVYFECTFEYTSQGVIHMHGYIVARKHAYANLVSRFKRFGFVRTDPIHDLEGWIEYMYKDQDQDSFPSICLSS